MVKRPADAIGMTFVSLALTAPVLIALWLALSGQRYEWIATVLPLVIMLGAPIAYVLTGLVGPKLGREVLALFRREKNGRQTVQTSGLAAGTASVTISSRPAAEQTGASAPTVLVYAADNVAVRVQEALSPTCKVTVATSTSDAITHIRRDAPLSVVVDPSVILALSGAKIPQATELLEAARKAVGPEHVYLVLVDIHIPDVSALKLWRLMRQVTDFQVVELEALAKHLHGAAKASD